MGIINKNVSAKPSQRGTSPGTTIIAEGNTFTGEMKITGMMHVDGNFHGDISSVDNITIGESGHVTGTIKARHINVCGLLEGETVCDELHIEPGGTVKGLVMSKEMSISPKGNFIGERKIWEQGADMPKLADQRAPIDAKVTHKKETAGAS